MATRTITGTILNAELVAYPNTPITFELKNDFTDLGVTYLSSEIAVLPDQTTGYFSVTLAVPTTPATAIYRIRLVSGEEQWIYLTSGPATDLATLLTLAGSPIAQSALQTVIDAHVLRSDVHYIPRHDTLTLAAYDAPTLSKNQADHICTGLTDESVIQNALADLPPVLGGSIKFTEGTFLMRWAGQINQDVLISPYCVKILETHPPISFVGIPGSTVIKLADTQPLDSCSILIRGSVANHRTNPVSFEGIVFDGNVAGQAGAVWTNFGIIAMGDADGLNIHNCRFKNWSRNGVHAAWTSQKVIISDSYFYGQGAIRLEMHNYTVHGNIFEDPHDDAYVPGGANVQIICDADRLFTSRMCSLIGNNFIGGSIPLLLNGSQHCVVMGNTFYDQGNLNEFAIELLIYDGGVGSRYDVSGNVIVGNTIYNCVNGIAVRGNGTTLNAHGNIIANNTIMVGPDRNMSFGIQEGWSLDAQNQIIDNYIDEAGVTTKITATGTGTIVRGNLNYKTENHGAAATMDDGDTIAHGLVAVPTWANVTCSAAGEMATVTTLDATNITVAIKKHDGSAGTQQTIYWEAEV